MANAYKQTFSDSTVFIANRIRTKATAKRKHAAATNIKEQSMNSYLYYKYCLLISALILSYSICFAEGIRVTKTSYPISDLSRIIAYTPSKEIAKRRIILQKMKSTQDIDKVLVQLSGKEIIESGAELKAEKALIADQNGTVNRSGRILTITRELAPPFIFENFSDREVRDHDGDSQDYVYTGMLDRTGYHMIEVIYMHDSPGTYFVNPKTGSMLYAHTGDHTLYLPSSNDRILVINNSLTPPFGLVVANIAGKEVSIELHCISHLSSNPEMRAHFEGWDNKLSSEFEGWRKKPEVGFELTVNLPKRAGSVKQKKESIAMQFIRSSGQWRIFVPDNLESSLSSRLSCWQ